MSLDHRLLRTRTQRSLTEPLKRAAGGESRTGHSAVAVGSRRRSDSGLKREEANSWSGFSMERSPLKNKSGVITHGHDTMPPAPIMVRPNLPVSPDPALAMAKLIKPPKTTVSHSRPQVTKSWGNVEMLRSSWGSTTRTHSATGSASEEVFSSSISDSSSSSSRLRMSHDSALPKRTRPIAAAPTPSSTPPPHHRHRIQSHKDDESLHHINSPPLLPRAALSTATKGWHFMASSLPSSPDPAPFLEEQKTDLRVALDKLPAGIECTLLSLPPLSAGSSEGTLRLFASRASIALRCVLFALRQSELRCQALQTSTNRAAGRVVELSQIKDSLERDLMTARENGNGDFSANHVSSDRVALAELQRRLALAERGQEEMSSSMSNAALQHKETISAHQLELAEIVAHMDQQRVELGGRVRRAEEAVISQRKREESLKEAVRHAEARQCQAEASAEKDQMLLAECRERLARARDEVAASESRVRALEEKRDVEARAAASAREETLASSDRVRDLEDEVDRLRRSVVAAPLDDMNKEYEKEIVRLRRDAASTKRHLESEAQNLKSIIHEYEEKEKLHFQGTNKNQSDDESALKHRSEDPAASTDNALRTVEASTQSETLGQTLEEETSLLRTQLEESTQAVDAHRKECDALSDEVRDLRSEAEQAALEHSFALSELRQANMDAVLAAEDSVRGTLTRLHKQQLDTVRIELVAARKSANSHKHHLETAREKITEMDSIIAALREQRQEDSEDRRLKMVDGSTQCEENGSRSSVMASKNVDADTQTEEIASRNKFTVEGESKQDIEEARGSSHDSASEHAETLLKAQLAHKEELKLVKSRADAEMKRKVSAVEQELTNQLEESSANAEQAHARINELERKVADLIWKQRRMKDEKRKILLQSKEEFDAKVEETVKKETAALRQVQAESNLKLRKAHKRELRALEEKVEIRVRKECGERVENIKREHVAEMDIVAREKANWERRAISAQVAYQDMSSLHEGASKSSLFETPLTDEETKGSIEAYSSEGFHQVFHISTPIGNRSVPNNGETPPTVRKPTIPVSEDEYASDDNSIDSSSDAATTSSGTRDYGIRRKKKTKRARQRKTSQSLRAMLPSPSASPEPSISNLRTPRRKQTRNSLPIKPRGNEKKPRGDTQRTGSRRLLSASLDRPIRARRMSSSLGSDHRLRQSHSSSTVKSNSNRGASRRRSTTSSGTRSPVRAIHYGFATNINKKTPRAARSARTKAKALRMANTKSRGRNQLKTSRSVQEQSDSDRVDISDDESDSADTSTRVVPTSTPSRVRDAVFHQENGSSSNHENHFISENGMQGHIEKGGSSEDVKMNAKDYATVSASMPSPPTLRKEKRKKASETEPSIVSYSYSGESYNVLAKDGERTGTWYSEMIARCRSQLKEQEKTLSAIRESQQRSRERRDEANASMRSLSSSFSSHSIRSQSGIMSSVASFLSASSDGGTLTTDSSKRAQKLYPEMLSPTDTKVLIDGVLRRSFTSSSSLRNEEDSDTSSKSEEVGQKGDPVQMESVVRENFRYDTMEVPSSPSWSLLKP